MPYIYKEVEIEVDLDDFDTEDLIEELESRGELVDGRYSDSTAVLRSIYEKRRLGKDYQQELTDLIYNVLGKIV